ncbi:MAG: ATP-binding cassette domain-containing protein, partial [Synergistaceae bacterium]|nr:ATP-binding cassette domain-containing protein [Synergistaceae bacterium]
MLKAVDDVSFHVDRGETFGIVGESGCGKSVACKSIVRLLACPPGKYESGEIIFNGQNTLKMSKAELRSLRGG